MAILTPRESMAILTPRESMAILTPRESMVILILLICESIGLLSQLFLGKNRLNNDVHKENASPKLTGRILQDASLSHMFNPMLVLCQLGTDILFMNIII